MGWSFSGLWSIQLKEYKMTSQSNQKRIEGGPLSAKSTILTLAFSLERAFDLTHETQGSRLISFLSLYLTW